ncbi:hypothetical protein FISHEDRAFT_76568 [Fistulina hepatica ATCC 64428]|uniref:Uncharacterized protein n=1 Tax=Fistulina hepatica ATCC 64428 TaxID=1128425 RepID=A0A0D7A3L4_9AGAR|nr:hypothetical protein FISHEDRAFT_76568 [Fistulina hepatica ATCC 64428]
MSSDGGTTERTPLLTTALPPASPSTANGRQVLPSIGPVLTALQNSGVEAMTSQDLCPYNFESPAISTAFILVVLLKHLSDMAASRPRRTSNNPWETWSSRQQHAVDTEICQRAITRIWDGFMGEYRTTVEIEEALWTAFPTEGATLPKKTLRAAHLLAGPDYISELARNHVVLGSLINTWYRGWSLREARNTRLWTRYDAVSTPAQVPDLPLFALLSHYIVYPLEPPHISFGDDLDLIGLREWAIVALSTSFALRKWRFSTVPLVLPCVAFLACLPSFPRAGESAFNVLLISWSWIVIQLHFQHPPSILLMLFPTQLLPFATFLGHALARIAYSVTLLFAPTLVVLSYLVSKSLEMDTLGTVLQGDVANFISPIETRETLLMVLAVIVSVALIAVSLTAMAPLSEEPTDSWDRYSRPIGNDARRQFLTAVIEYSQKYSFPSPFNVPHVIAVGIPRLLGNMFGRSSEVDRFLNALNVEGWLWRILVGPWALVIWVVLRTCDTFIHH